VAERLETCLKSPWDGFLGQEVMALLPRGYASHAIVHLGNVRLLHQIRSENPKRLTVALDLFHLLIGELISTWIFVWRRRRSTIAVGPGLSRWWRLRQ
jgi:hypothetical protein